MRILLIILSLSLIAQAAIVDLEPLGESYPIAEVDFEVFLKQRAAGVDWEAIVNQNFERSFKEAVTAKEKLPPASKDAVRRVTPSYTLENEIFNVDKNGVKTVIYPAGFKYNPLDYMQLDTAYYIINATRPAEVKWLQEQDSGSAMVIISEGEAIAFSEVIEQPVYILNSYIREGFFVEHTPSLVKQEKNQIVVYEYRLDELKGGTK